MSPPILAALGIDQANRSGWGISVERKVIESGVASNHAERKAVVLRALQLAGGDPRALLVMLEDHGVMRLSRLTNADTTTKRTNGRQAAPERGTRQILGMGAARGRWEALLDEYEHPLSLRDEVDARVWRGRLGIRQLDDEAFGRWCAEHDVKPSASSPWKAAACIWLSAHLGREVTDPDEGDGGCIAAFAGIDGLMRREARLAAARSKALGKRQQSKQLVLGGRS